MLFRLIIIYFFTISVESAFANDLKVWLSNNSVLNDQMYLVSDSSAATPGTVVGQHLSGVFRLNFKGSLSQAIIFSPNDPLKWAKVTTSANGDTIIDKMPDTYFTFSDTIKFAAILNGTAGALSVSKSDKVSFPLIYVYKSFNSFSLDDKLSSEFGKFTFFNGNKHDSVPLGEASHPYLSEQFQGIWLVPYKESVNVEFSLNRDALYTKFTLPSRQGCALNLTRYTKISASETEVNFTQTENISLPVFKYWFTSSNNTQGFEYSVDRMTAKEGTLVLHDSSTNSCMCMSNHEPTGNLAESCYECSCE